MDETVEQVRDQVRCYGIHSDYHQWERPFPVPLHVFDPTENRQVKEAEPTAEQHPARCPDAFHYGADARKMKRGACPDPNHTGDQKPLHGNSWRSRPEPAA